MKTSQLGTGNTVSFVEWCKEGEGGKSNACTASPGPPPGSPNQDLQKADLPEHGETMQQENESLGVKYNSSAVVEYKSWEEREGRNHAVAAMETTSSPSQGGDVPKSWAAWLLLTSQARPPPTLHLSALS